MGKLSITSLAMMSSIIFMSMRDIDATVTGYRRPFCTEHMIWAPFFTNRPYTTLLNSAFCPSWITRNIISKDSQNTHLYLPYGMPFSFFCGACFTGNTKLAKTLTLKQEVYGDASSPYSLNQVSILTKDGAEEFRENGHKCKIEYGITKPLEYDGSLICKVQLGKFNSEEISTFTVVKTPIIRSNETIEVSTDTATLVCPEHPKPIANNPLTHVWFLPNAPGEKMAASTNNPQVTFRINSRRPLVVACATYHIYSEEKVIEKTFIVRKISTGSFTAHQHSLVNSQRSYETNNAGKAEDSYQVYGEDDVAASVSTAGGSLNIIIIVVVSITAVVLLLIVLLSIPKWIKSRRGR